MQIKINGIDHTLRFGLKFIRELDEKYYFEKNGVKFGATLEDRVPLIFSHDPVTLADFLYSATATEDNRPTRDQIDTYIEECEDIDKLFEEVLSELKNSNITKKVTKRTAAVMDLAEQEEQAPEKTQKKPTTK